MPKDEAGAAEIAADHNSRLIDPEVFLPLYATYQKVLAEEAEVRGRKQKVRKTMKAAGIKLKILDAQMTLAELPLDEMRDHLRQEQEIRRYLKAPIGHQFSMFGDDAAPDPLDDSDEATAKRMAPIVDDAKAKGFLAGISGKEADNPHDGNSEPGLAWQGGWNDGRAVFDKSPEPMSGEDDGDDD